MTVECSLETLVVVLNLDVQIVLSFGRLCIGLDLMESGFCGSYLSWSQSTRRTGFEQVLCSSKTHCLHFQNSKFQTPFRQQMHEDWPAPIGVLGPSPARCCAKLLRLQATRGRMPRRKITVKRHLLVFKN